MRKKIQKLTLTRDTLRSLEEIRLDKAAAGAVTNPCPISFPRTHCPQICHTGADC